jgi:hypothetical protein
MKKVNENIEKVINTAIRLMELADKGDLCREDDGCGVLFGSVRDFAYSMKNRAEAEKQSHINKGRWL